MEHIDEVDPVGRRTFLKRAGLAVLASVPIVQLMQAGTAAAIPAASPAARCSKVKLDVAEQCTAPANPPNNGCNILGTVPGVGLGGTDIHWIATLFYGVEWRIQFQAFTEETDRECQYPIKVKGSYFGDGLPAVPFNTSDSFSLGLTPEDFPELTLQIDSIKIDPCHPRCD